MELYLYEAKKIYYILGIPDSMRENAELFVETYNSCGLQRGRYIDNVGDALSEGGNNIEKLIIKMITDFPIVMPIIPNLFCLPDCQQLSLEAVRDFKIHEKVALCIQEAKLKIEEITNKKTQDKIFLCGYSASGVFAQRFALIYPELIGRCLVGGAAGTIPIPSDKLDYPIGIGDYNYLFNKEFDISLYRKIKFGYYVGEDEEVDLYEWKKNCENTNLCHDKENQPTHDMSFREKTTPKKVAIAQREYLGERMGQRYINSILINKKYGIDIEGIIVKGVNHRNILDERNLQYNALTKQILEFYFNNIQLNPDGEHCCNHIREYEGGD